MSKHMMTSLSQTMTCTSITHHIRELKSSMDKVEFAADGYSSDGEDSENENEANHIFEEVCVEPKIVPTFKPKHKFFERRIPVFKGPSGPKPVQITTRSTLFSRKDNTSCTNHERKNDERNSENRGSNVDLTNSNETRISQIEEENNKYTTHIQRYSDEDLKPIISGQRQEEEDIPIMTLPALPEKPKIEFSMNSRRVPCLSMYPKSMTFRFLSAGDRLNCSFKPEKASKETSVLLDNVTSVNCFCASLNVTDDDFGGWVTAPKVIKAKLDKRRKSTKPIAESPFSRLSNTLGKDPMIFHHYTDWRKYIERYRFYHTTNNAGRPSSYNRYSEKQPETDHIFSKKHSIQ